MISKAKLIACIIIILIAVVSVISTFIYIDALNDDITDLNVTIANQNNEIKSLNDDIVLLETNLDELNKDLEAIRNIVNITNEYINGLEVIYTKEDEIKTAIYEEVIYDDETKEWFNEKLPSNLIDLLNQRSNDGMCQDSLSN